jgi:hypothetical protein
LGFFQELETNWALPIQLASAVQRFLKSIGDFAEALPSMLGHLPIARGVEVQRT